MQPAERIKTINELNDLGIRLARVPTLENALRLHAEAAALADNSGINRDYVAVSRANMGYALRQLGRYGEANDLLMSTLSKVEYSSIEPRGSYAGLGRVLEELGIVTADMPLLPDEETETKISNIQRGLEFFGEAIDNYKCALANPSAEIYTLPQLEQRKLRTMGMRSPKARDLYELSVISSDKRAWIEKAVEYATEEVTAREALGEKEGQNLANAYHTFGVSLTETVADAPGNYEKVREIFDKAAAIPGVHANTLVTLQFRRTWLEYRRDPEARAIIAPFFDSFLQRTAALTAADKNALNKRVLELGQHLGGDFVEKVKGFYTG